MKFAPTIRETTASGWRSLDGARARPRCFFIPPAEIDGKTSYVAAVVRELDNLRAIPEAAYTATLAEAYNAVNQVHTCREGKRCTQREFRSAVARLGPPCRLAAGER